MADFAQTGYAKNATVHVAYQVMGNGPLDLVLVPGFVSHLELQLEDPRPMRFFERLSSFCRLIRFDKRGTGLSDRTGAIPTLEERMDDVRAVMDTVGSKRAALLGLSEGGSMSILFAATHPQRTSALILYGAMARPAWAPDNPWGTRDADQSSVLRLIEKHWGKGRSVDIYAPSLARNDEYVRWTGRHERAAASPGAALGLVQINHEIDVRHVLPTIAIPTLVLHRTGDIPVPVEHGRYLAKHIPGAKYLELQGNDHMPWAGDVDALCDEVQGFLTGARRGHEPDRILTTVLFTDIVDATKRAAEMGDRGWKELLRQHHFIVRQQLDRHRGREIDTAGDGFFASFDGPARAVRCGRAIVDAVKSLQMEIRAGVHTGECEVMGDKLGGIAVHIGARVLAQAAPSEVLVSATVKDLVAGSGIQFEERGVHQLRGIPGQWRLLAAR
jgi:pimeloyl-ACP methyl ester carboxylesterase